MSATHTLHKTNKGEIRVKYACPKCGQKLESAIGEAGNTDHCPFCTTRFVVPGIRDRLQLAESQLAEKSDVVGSLYRDLGSAQKLLSERESVIEQSQLKLAAMQQVAEQQSLQTVAMRQHEATRDAPIVARVVTALAYIALAVFVAYEALGYLLRIGNVDSAVQQSTLAAMVAAEVVVAYVVARCIEKVAKSLGG